MSRRISQPHVLGFIYQLLCWNRVAKPVVLNTMKPIFKNISFLPKGVAGRFFGGKKVKDLKQKFEFFGGLFIHCQAEF
jgi:hypothetical protein